MLSLLELEVLVTQKEHLLYCYPSRIPFLADCDTSMISEFLTAVESFAKTVLKDELRFIVLANCWIFFRQSQDLLFTFISPDYSPFAYCDDLSNRILSYLRIHSSIMRLWSSTEEFENLTAFIQTEMAGVQKNSTKPGQY
jgi:hypothetical protein